MTYLPQAQAAGATTVRGAIGLARAGWRLRWDTHEHRVDDTTSWGKTLIEMIYLGADWHLQAELLEYSIGTTTALVWPWNPVTAPMGTTFGAQLAGVGSRATNFGSGSLVLTAIAGTPAAASPAALTAPQAIGHGSWFSMDSKNREMPLDARLLPSTASPGLGGLTTWFTTS